MAHIPDPNMYNQIDHVAAKHRDAIRESRRRSRLGIPERKASWSDWLIILIVLPIFLFLVGGLVFLLLF